jgi:hypothetical protein
MGASKNGKIAGIVEYKPKVTNSKVTVEIKVRNRVVMSKFSELSGSTTYCQIVSAGSKVPDGRWLY